FTFRAGTVIEPGGFLALTETELNFALRAAGETIYLINNDETRVLDAVRFDGQARDVSYGRTPDGGPRWRPLAARTPGQPNSPARNPEVVINEILYAPLSDQDDDQFVELHNPGIGTVTLDGWRFVDGIDYTFPNNMTLGPGGYLVVARNAVRL